MITRKVVNGVELCRRPRKKESVAEDAEDDEEEGDQADASVRPSGSTVTQSQSVPATTSSHYNEFAGEGEEVVEGAAKPADDDDDWIWEPCQRDEEDEGILMYIISYIQQQLVYLHEQSFMRIMAYEIV